MASLHFASNRYWRPIRSPGSKDIGDRHTMLNLRRRGRRVVIGGAIAGAASIALAFAAPAGASTTTKTGNSVILGSGSSTT